MHFVTCIEDGKISRSPIILSSLYSTGLWYIVYFLSTIYIRFFISRLRWWFFSEAHSSLSLPEEPPAHQWHPQWDCCARRSLSGHYSPHAGPEEAGPVSDGAPGGWNTIMGRCQGRTPDGWTVFSTTTSQPILSKLHLFMTSRLTVSAFMCLWYRESWKQNFCRSKIVIKTRREGFWKLQTHSMQS